MVAEIFKGEGVMSITVSSLFMAQKFAERGFDDIFIAIPFNPAQCDIVSNWLKTCPNIKLILLLDDLSAAEQIFITLGNAVRYSIKVDTGYHRAGILADDSPAFFRMIELLNKYHLLDNLYSLTAHFGHVYNAKTKTEIVEINTIGIQKLKRLQREILASFAKAPLISIGDTPSLSIYNSQLLNGVGELRPGNFVFYDAMQYLNGYCTLNDIGAVLQVPVLAVYPQRNEVLVHAGAVHLSKEFYMHGDSRIYGLPVKIVDKDKWEIYPNSCVIQLSQEHGIIKFASGVPAGISSGNFIAIIPIHSCLMMACMNPDYL